MLVKRAYKFRLYPTAEQERVLARQFGASRFVYNHFLRARIDYYLANKDGAKKGLTYHDTALMLTQLKQQPEYEWLKEANAQALQQALRDLDNAYRNFFDHRARFPRFKRKHDRQSFRVPQGFRVQDNRLVIPKVSPIKMVIHRPIEGTMKHVTVSRTKTGHYYASILCEVEMPEPEYQGGEIGIDLGLKSFLATSEGETVNSPKYLRKAERRLKRLQRRLSRRKKGSKGREKTRRQVARQHEKVANQRSDFLHKLSRRLVDENQAIHAESLNVKGMLANHRLAKSIADSGWGEFVRQLSYKGEWYGCRLVQIDRFFPSSRRCAACGFINQELRLSDREWACPACGVIHDRDHNAAVNILLVGRATAGAAESYAGGEGVRRFSEAPPRRSRKLPVSNGE